MDTGSYMANQMDNLIESSVRQHEDEELKIIELLKPRYQVISRYPFTCLPIGYIIDKPTPLVHFQALNNLVTDLEYISEYPKIFNPLYWYEQRSDEVMDSVKYVKRVGNYKTGEVLKVADKSQDGRIYHKDNEIENRFIRDNSFIPVTESDFINYQQSKQQ